MTRIVKEHTVRRNEILEAAERLVYTRGYDVMTVQDILDALQISKGAFYHYFDSKQALLEALIDRMLQQVLPILTPIVNDPTLSALEKFQLFFNTAGRWKTAKKASLLPLLRVWYNDENAIVRQKQFDATVSATAPLLASIIRQGVQEGVFTTPYPEQVGGLAMLMLQGAGDSMARLIMGRVPLNGELEYAQNVVAAYTDSVERILGAPKGSIRLIDDEVLRVWFVPTPEEDFANSSR